MTTQCLSDGGREIFVVSCCHSYKSTIHSIINNLSSFCLLTPETLLLHVHNSNVNKPSTHDIHIHHASTHLSAFLQTWHKRCMHLHYTQYITCTHINHVHIYTHTVSLTHTCTTQTNVHTHTHSKPIKSTVLIREQARPILSGLFVKLARDDGKGELRSLYTIHHKQNTCAPHSISKWAHHTTNTGKHPPQAEHMRPTFNQ